MKTEKRKHILQRIITLIAAGVFLFSFYKLVPILYDYYTNNRTLESVQQVYELGRNEAEQYGEGQVRASFQPLLEINKDMVGWITIDQTKIDYPVLQSKDNEFYLTRNYKKQDTRAGSIFLDFRNDKKLENNKNVIIYGHRMKDGSMFGQLKKYLDKDFFKSNKTIYLDSLYEGYDIEVFSVYQTTTSFYYIETEFPEQQSFQKFIDQIKEKSFFSSDISINQEDTIVTLSTCDYALDSLEGRLVVHGKLVKRGDSE